jgi:hypothetical protein
MNQNTWISWITTGIGLAGSAAVTKGLVDSSTATSIVGAAGVLVPLIWGFFVHSNASVVQAAAAVPGVKAIDITPTAPPDLQKLAMDPTVPKVQVTSTYRS